MDPLDGVNPTGPKTAYGEATKAGIQMVFGNLE
jgi:hypothetical protein